MEFAYYEIHWQTTRVPGYPEKNAKAAQYSGRAFSQAKELVRLQSRLGHCASKAQGSHVRPDLCDPVKALLPFALESRLAPPERYLTIARPNRVLLFMIYHNLERTVILFI
jgi:hypothetical protein